MIYLNNNDIENLGQNWQKLIDIISDGIKLLKEGDYSQPIKLYLRYKSTKNRIIAMPAYIGYKSGVAGLKWIASFPDNLKIGLTRANSITILNNVNTGVPEAIINSSKISSVRTASVSGSVLRKYVSDKNLKKLVVAIIGFGPIGYEHYQMCKSLLGNAASYKIFDMNPKVFEKHTFDENTKRANSLEDAMSDADVVIAATNALEPYISNRPKDGSLVLNVSLRDFVPDYLDFVSGGIIVDDWDEVNREGTNIESFSKQKNLKKEDVLEIKDLLTGKFIFQEGQNYMFCPMGMAVFDMLVADYYNQRAIAIGCGANLQ